MPPTRTSRRPQRQTRVFCEHPDCEGKGALAADSLPRHQAALHDGGKVKKSPCYFCVALVSDSSRSVHMAENHKPVAGKDQCLGCKISWMGNMDRKKRHYEKCANANESEFVFSQVLGIYIRPEVKPKLTYYFYKKAEDADHFWTTVLNRTSFADSESRFKAFELEVQKFNGQGSVWQEAQQSAGQEAQQSSGQEGHHSADSPMTATKELNNLFAVVSRTPTPPSQLRSPAHSNVLDTSNFGTLVHPSATDTLPRCIISTGYGGYPSHPHDFIDPSVIQGPPRPPPNQAFSQYYSSYTPTQESDKSTPSRSHDSSHPEGYQHLGWHFLGKPNLSLRKAAMYRLPI